MLQVCFGKSDVARTAHVQSTHRLRNRAFYSCTFVLALLKLWQLLLSPGSGKSYVR